MLVVQKYQLLGFLISQIAVGYPFIIYSDARDVYMVYKLI